MDLNHPSSALSWPIVENKEFEHDFDDFLLKFLVILYTVHGGQNLTDECKISNSYTRISPTCTYYVWPAVAYFWFDEFENDDFESDKFCVR